MGGVKKKISKLALPLLGMTAGLQVADPMISSIALVQASKSLEFSASTTALAAGISTLALSASVISSGLLADRVGRKKVLILALLLAAVGDLLVATSLGATQYLIGRAVAGIGLGAVFGSSFAYVREVVGKGSMGKALSIFFAILTAMEIAVTLVGGSLVTLNWRFAYLVVPALSLASAALVLFILPKVPKLKGGKIDYLSMGLIAVGVTGILYGISNISTSATSPLTWAPIAVGVLSLIWFVFVEKRRSYALFPIRLFLSPIFLAAVVLGLARNMSQAVATLQLSNLWQYVNKYDSIAVSFGQLPLSILMIVGSLIVGRNLAKGKSPRSQAVIGLFTIAAGFVGLSLIHANAPYWYFVIPMVIIGAGLPFAAVTEGQLYMKEAPKKDFGPVTSSKTTIGQFGYSIGLSASMVAMDMLTKLRITSDLTNAGVAPSQIGQGLDAVRNYIVTGTAPSTALGQQALSNASSAYTSGFSTLMIAMAALMVGCGVLCLFLLSGRKAKGA